MKVKPEDITVRDFTLAEVEPMATYWTEGSAEFWLSRGVDKSKLKTKNEFIELYSKTIREKGELRNGCVIEYQGKAIGAHSLTDLVENDHAIFHAHIWYPEYRGRGIGVYSYLKAADFFIKKLNLKKIIFKTPKMNVAPNKIKAKIGIPCLGDTVFDAPILLKPLDSNLYELDVNLLKQLKQRHGIA